MRICSSHASFAAGTGDGRRRRSAPASRDRGPPRVVVLNKPYNVLCAFTPAVPGQQRTLAEFVSVPDVYPAGRLDQDSEGLVVLTNGNLQSLIAEPKRRVVKRYWVCVEGCPAEEQLDALRNGVLLKDGPTEPAGVRVLDADYVESLLWPRTPPIRSRLSVPHAWIELRIQEGRNRQVRRMTASVKLPTLRLVRISVGDFSLLNADDSAVELPCGSCRELAPLEWQTLLP